MLFGTFLNAASVGAKTVYGPPFASVSARPALVSRLASVLKLPAATAVSTMFFFAAEAVGAELVV